MQWQQEVRAQRCAWRAGQDWRCLLALKTECDYIQTRYVHVADETLIRVWNHENQHRKETSSIHSGTSCIPLKMKQMFLTDHL